MPHGTDTSTEHSSVRGRITACMKWLIMFFQYYTNTCLL